MAWPFDGVQKWFNDKYEEYFVIPKNLAIVEDIIAKDETEIIKNNIELLKARDVLKNRPDLLPEHLKSFVTKKIDKEGLPAHIAKNISAKKIDPTLLEKYVTTPNAFKKALDNFTKIIHTDYTNPDLEYTMNDLGYALDELKKYPTFLEKTGLTKLARLVSSNYTHDNIFSDKIDPIKNEIVDHSLAVLRNIIESDNIVSNHKEQIESAMETLKLYPEILKTKGMEYLIPFVNSDLGNPTFLSIAIGKTIPPETAEELIKTGKFTPLATEKTSIPNVTANNINVMYKGDESAEGRCFDNTQAFLKKSGMTEEAAAQTTKHLQEDYPLLLGIASLKDIEKNNAASSIIAQREGFDLDLYRQEVAFVKDTKKALTKIAKEEKILPEMLSILNEQAREIREYYASIPQDLSKPGGKKILSGEEKKRDALLPQKEKIVTPPVQKKKSWRLFRSKHKEDKPVIETPSTTPKSKSMFNFFGRSNSQHR